MKPNRASLVPAS